MRIVKLKGDSKHDNSEYNPDYLKLLTVMINSLDIESKFFVDKIYHLIIKPDIFHKLLFLNEGKEDK